MIINNIINSNIVSNTLSINKGKISDDDFYSTFLRKKI